MAPHHKLKKKRERHSCYLYKYSAYAISFNIFCTSFKTSEDEKIKAIIKALRRPNIYTEKKGNQVNGMGFNN